MALLPMAMYGLEVPPGDVAIMAHADIPASFRVTMAAIDPSAEPEGDPDEIVHPRATLKVLRLPLGDDYDDESDDEMDIEDMDAQFGESDESSDDDDNEVNGGPSDPAKSKKARKEAAEAEIRKLLESEGMDLDDEDDEDEDDEAIPNGINGITKSKKAKGKMPKSDEDLEEDDSDLDDEDIGGEIEEFVLCTLDPTKSFQQPLDITFGEDERVWFKVSGTHTIYLTGNYVEPVDGNPDMFDPDSDEEDEYDLSPDDDELDESEDESMDELDEIEDPRITGLEDDEDAPALVKAKKIVGKSANKNKRAAPDSADEDEVNGGAETLDELITQGAKNAQAEANAEPKLSKKQLKKLKKNNGDAASAPVVEKVTETKIEAEAPSSNKSDKKVSFAAQLEQGPTPTKDKKDGKAKATVGVKTVQGVVIDDRKLGSGQAAKNGDRVGMRYIGKLKADNKVFDENKKGKPFTFKVGSGEVIKGWDIGIAGMQVGGERRITIPAHLAYGSKKLPGIPSNSTLIFDIKMVDINKGK